MSWHNTKMRLTERRVLQRLSRCPLFFCRWGNRLEWWWCDFPRVIQLVSDTEGLVARAPSPTVSHLKISPTNQHVGLLGSTSYLGSVETVVYTISVFLFFHTWKIISCNYCCFNQHIFCLYFHQCKFDFKGENFKHGTEEIPVFVCLS